MIFRKSERKKLPTLLWLTVGGLAVVGFMSIKKRGKEMASNTAHKMKNMLHKKCECDYPMGSCE
jgi:hypothetical protein